MRMRMFALALVAGAALSGAAHSQNAQLSQSRVMQTVSVADVVRLLAAVDIAATQAEVSEDGIALEARLSSGASFFIMMRGCDAAGANCGLVQPFILFDTAGVSLAEVNDYNLNHSALSMAMLSPAGFGVLGIRVYPEGGITEASLINSLAIFLDDIGRFVRAVYPAASASLEAAPAGSEARATAVSMSEEASGAFAIAKAAKPIKLGEDAPSFAHDPMAKIRKN